MRRRPRASELKPRQTSDSQCCLQRPYRCPSTQESAPATTGQFVRAMMSQRLCKPLCSRPASSTSAKHWQSDTVAELDLILLLRERDVSEKNLSLARLSKARAPRRILVPAVVQLHCPPTEPQEPQRWLRPRYFTRGHQPAPIAPGAPNPAHRLVATSACR